MLKSLLIVGAGSFVGGALRYLISTYMKNICGQGFPWGTLAVNLLGCFVIGILFAAFSKYSATDNAWYLLLTTGVCGGFTTFSTFLGPIISKSSFLSALPIVNSNPGKPLI